MTTSSDARRALFDLQFMLLMIQVGRNDEARRAYNKVEEYLNEQIEKEESNDSD